MTKNRLLFSLGPLSPYPFNISSPPLTLPVRPPPLFLSLNLSLSIPPLFLSLYISSYSLSLPASMSVSVSVCMCVSLSLSQHYFTAIDLVSSAF